MNNAELWAFVRDRFEALEAAVESVRAEIKALRIDMNGRIRPLEGRWQRALTVGDLLRGAWPVLALAAIVIAQLVVVLR